MENTPPSATTRQKSPVLIGLKFKEAWLWDFKRRDGWMKKAANYGSKTSKHAENAPYSSKIPSEVTSQME